MTERIRLATPGDADVVRDIYAPFVTSTPVTFEESPPSADEMADRIETTLESHPWLVYERDDAVVGYAKASRLRSMDAYRWTVELSVYVAEQARRSGVGRGLYESLFAVLERQGFAEAYAVTTIPNPATVAFHERMGFEPIADFPGVGYSRGEWRDVRWWRRPLAGKPADPDPPTPLSELRDDPAVDVPALVRTGTDPTDRS